MNDAFIVELDYHICLNGNHHSIWNYLERFEGGQINIASPDDYHFKCSQSSHVCSVEIMKFHLISLVLALSALYDASAQSSKLDPDLILLHPYCQTKLDSLCASG